MAPQPLLDVLSRTPCAHHPTRPPAKGTGTGSLLRSIAATQLQPCKQPQRYEENNQKNASRNRTGKPRAFSAAASI